jgi:glucokinase
VSETFIGVDVGGTKIAVAVLDGATLGEALVTPTDKSGSDALVEQLAASIEKARTDQTAAVGLGVPSVVEFATGRVKSSVNVPLKDVELRTVLGDRLGLPVFVDNDATVAALAEAHDDDGRIAVRDLVMLTVGTGVGGGLVIGGRLYRGATGAAAEVGHTIVGLDMSEGVAAPPGFPAPGSLEALAAGTALDKLAATSARDHPDSALGRRAAAGESVLGPDVVAAAADGDEQARRMVALLGQRLGIGIANAINLFDPEEVVIGGGAAQAGELLLGPAREVARAYVVPGAGESTEIRLARHGVGAGVLGAALLARQERERETSGGDA